MEVEKVKRAFFLGMITLLFLFSSCAPPVEVYNADPTTRNVRNDYFDVEFTPQKSEGKNYFDHFRLVIKNKTDKALILDWNQCNYLYQGKRRGLFGWEGLTFEILKKTRQHPKIPIGAGATNTSLIFPLELLGWDIHLSQSSAKRKRPEDAYHLGIIPAGMNGIRIYATQDGKVIKERIMVNITK